MDEKFDATYFYDQVSEIYDRDTHPFIMNPAGSYAKGFASLISYLNPSSVLELGAGTGKRFISVCHYYEENNLPLPKWSIVEPSEGMRSKIPKNIKDKLDTIYIEEDLNQFTDNKFDLTFSSGLLCSIQTRQAAHIAKECYRIAKCFTMQTDTPKDRPHLNKLDLLKYFNIKGTNIMHWDKLTPYPYPSEEEHRIIVKKTGSLNFADDFPLLAERVGNDETWQEVLKKRLQD